MRRFLVLGLGLALVACKKSDTPATQKTVEGATAKAEEAPTYDAVPREAFNRLAAAEALPVFWIADEDGDGAIDPDEVAELWGVPGPDEEWIVDGAFTDAFANAYRALAKGSRSGPDVSKYEAVEQVRRKAVLKELAQGRPTVVVSDFTDASEDDKAVVRLVVEAAELIEKIHAKQTGAAGLDEEIAKNDPASRMLFYRNQGPWCVAPATENDPGCNAIGAKPKKVSGLYPAALQENDGFCDELAKRKDADTLMHQFHVVKQEGDELVAVPYTVAYEDEMTAISEKLKAAAEKVGEDEAPFAAYLNAAAESFETNDWQPADEAWSKMNVGNSKWYLRIGPDEVYFEPCRRKAGFHVSFARINQDSVTWQSKLNPVKSDMEKAIAELAGKPYKARDVSFHMPDFIDIILNAGDSRSAHGATIGQSLPNWGPVANEGRGRTVAMTNLYTDEDSKVALEEQAKSLLCPTTMKNYTRDPGVQVMSTVLHEAAHNLGPAHEYKVKGKTASQIFGGPTASMLEELKAQTSALYFTDWLQERGIIDAKTAKQAHLRDMVWSFGHISRGMYTAENRPKPYSQLAAIQFGDLMNAGAITWKADERAANNTDVGCFEMDLEAFPKVILALEKRVAGIKARGDVKDAKAIIAEYVDVKGDKKKVLDTIRDRWLRAPKASFVYAIEL